jgi:hypothetical protein
LRVFVQDLFVFVGGWLEVEYGLFTVPVKV